MRKGAIMAVSSALLASLAIGEKVDPEELGGWRLHAETTGFVDVVVDTDEEAFDAIKRFLSYLPSHHNEAPPERAGAGGLGRGHGRHPATCCREKRTQVYDVRKIIRTVVDKDSFFELKPRFGKVAVTGARAPRRPERRHRRQQPAASRAARSTPTPATRSRASWCCATPSTSRSCCSSTRRASSIGTEAERKRAPGKIMNFMNALHARAPCRKLSVILRKSYGRAYVNMGGGRHSDEVAAWPTAEVSFMDPTFATKIVHGLEPGEPGFDEALARMSKDSEVWDIAVDLRGAGGDPAGGDARLPDPHARRAPAAHDRRRRAST